MRFSAIVFLSGMICCGIADCGEVKLSLPEKSRIVTPKGEGMRLKNQTLRLPLGRTLDTGTVTAWIRTSGVPRPKTALSCLTLLGKDGTISFLYHDGAVPMVYGVSGKKQEDALSLWNKAVPRHYAHWAFSWKLLPDGSCFGRFFCNGIKIAERKMNFSGAAGIHSLLLGSKEFDGEIAALKVFDSELDGKEILAQAAGWEFEKNLLFNGGFELTGDNRTGSGWMCDIWNMLPDRKREEIALFRLDGDQPFRGSYSQQIVTVYSGGGRGWPALFTYAALKKDRKYRLTFYSRQAGMPIGAELLFRCNKKGTRPYLMTPLTVPGEWTEFNYEFTSPRDDDRAQLIFLNRGKSGCWWIDDVSLTEIQEVGEIKNQSR